MTDYGQTPSVLTEHVLERAGCHLHYWLGGPAKAPMVVLLHGAVLDHRLFNAQVATLVPYYQVLVWDARGHGKSQPLGDDISVDICADDLRAILDDLGVERAVIGGHSFGGFVAQAFYAQAPERVCAIIVIDSIPLRKAYSRFEMLAMRAALIILDWCPYKLLARLMAMGAARTKEARRYVVHAIQQISRRNFRRIWQAVNQAVVDNRREDPASEVPLLLIHGDDDKVGPIRRDMLHLAQAEPWATYRIIPHSGHNANQDNARFTNSILLDFLSLIRTRGGKPDQPWGTAWA